MQIGATLQRLRDRQGRSLGELARVTRIPEITLGRLEADAFEMLPAPVYVRGFIRAYCEALGEDPTELLIQHERRLLAEEAELETTHDGESWHYPAAAQSWIGSADRVGIGHALVLALASLAFIAALIAAMRMAPAERTASTEEVAPGQGDAVSSAVAGERP